MLSNSYFERILKHKKYFIDVEVALMSPSQATAYRISGDIRKKGTIDDEKKYINKLIRHLERGYYDVRRLIRL